MGQPGAGILFTAFELSGDEHAAPVIAEIRRQRPDLPIWALGGARMAAAGAEIIERTTDKAAMLHNAAAQALEHKRRLGRLAAWLAYHEVRALVPVDSPAANWSICSLIRRKKPEARIIHLVAPQLWAWAGWRIRKMRRLSDHVLCLLPFEPAWFTARGVAATFVGHPGFAPPGVADAGAGLEAWAVERFLPGHPRLALLPGSRMGEINANWPTMLRVVRELRNRRPGLAAAIAAVDDRIAARIHELSVEVGYWPQGLELFVGQAPGVLGWCDVALVTSGTATLHAAVQRKPMVVIFNTTRLGWHLAARWFIRTRTFALPNLLAPGEGGTHQIAEFVPHFRQVKPVLREVERLIADPAAAAPQRAAFERIAALFAGHNYAAEAAEKILDLAS